MHRKLSTDEIKPLVRSASTTDIEGILALVRELAHYERAADKVTVTPESYRRDFDAGYFEALVAEVDTEIIGIAIYYKTFSSWKGRMMYLEDFVVREEYRRSGVGKLLFEEFIKRAKEAQSALCKWQVLRWNELAINFYKKYDTVFDDEWVDVKVYF